VVGFFFIVLLSFGSFALAAKRHKEYYMGEGGGFLRVRAMVSLMNPKLPAACLSTKGAPKMVLTNLLVGLMQVRVSN